MAAASWLTVAGFSTGWLVIRFFTPKSLPPYPVSGHRA